MDFAAPPSARPWYVQFWPWFLIALPLASVVVSVVALVLAVNHADALVRDDWYKSGLAINRDLGREQRAAELGLSATIAIGSGGSDLVVTLPRAIDGELVLELHHPTFAARDQVVRLVHRDGATYSGTASALAGRWHLTLHPASEQWALSGVMWLEPGTARRLIPEG